jgi:hypothetical protein
MKKITFASVCVLLTLTVLVRVSSSATYDPWVDLDESGDVDIFDVVTLANSYQTTGDPTKNVVIAGRAHSLAHTVYAYPLSPLARARSSSSGRTTGCTRQRWMLSPLAILMPKAQSREYRLPVEVSS